MKDRFILLPFGVLFFALCAVCEYLYDQKVCDPEWQTVENNLKYIESPFTIRSFRLMPAYSYQPANLVNDTVSITDLTTIEDIRTMICGRHSKKYDHPVSTWDVRIEMVLENSVRFSFIVSKLSSDKNADMTHIYFGSLHCPDANPSCSLTLGKYLERLTNYKKSHK